MGTREIGLSSVIRAVVAGAIALSTASAADSSDAAPAGHLRMVHAYERLAAIELRVAEEALHAERTLERLGHASAADVADRQARVATARLRVRACRRHAAFLREMPSRVAATPTVAGDDAGSVVAEARASAIDPFVTLADERLRRTRAAADAGNDAEITALELALERLRCERDVIAATPVAGPPPSPPEAAALAAQVAGHWSRCLRDAAGEIAAASPPSGWAGEIESMAAAVRRLAASDAFFAGEAEWRSMEAAATTAEANAVRSRAALLAARRGSPAPTDRTEWAFRQLDGSLSRAPAASRSDRRTALAARRALADRRASALGQLRGEGHASWLEHATAVAEAESLRLSIAAIDAEERLDRTHTLLARRIVERGERVAARD